MVWSNRQLESETEEWRIRLPPGSTYACVIGVSTTLLPSVTSEESRSRQRQRIARLEQEDSQSLPTFSANSCGRGTSCREGRQQALRYRRFCWCGSQPYVTYCACHHGRVSPQHLG